MWLTIPISLYPGKAKPTIQSKVVTSTRITIRTNY
jgi:hypothetical protein